MLLPARVLRVSFTFKKLEKVQNSSLAIPHCRAPPRPRTTRHIESILPFSAEVWAAISAEWVRFRIGATTRLPACDEFLHQRVA
jgi:hypothetical protein